jgi:hypothetical protein
LKLFRLRETSRTSLSAFDCNGPIYTVKLHFVDPVSGRKIPGGRAIMGWIKEKMCAATIRMAMRKKAQADYDNFLLRL